VGRAIRLQYDYPIWGTGKGDAAESSTGDGLNTTYSWLALCIKGGRVVGTNLGTISPNLTC
jgi:hypothetical protein